ncbi:MFS transporter [Steroidobacter agaridevorans]|uniref:MFS transporter n=1 Tax=Steroidobacter agaridevorans TaxID=2695856 RepID=A0A829YC26_9GAMM|nr:MFS transporter [Steroidobacter agaridevorans]GFE80755.1 MFS transporter [Steroidobacter agaridevorans]
MAPQRLFVLIAGNFFVATSFLSVGGLLSDISSSLQIPIEQAGLLIAAFGIAAAVCAPTLATLGSRIDRRKLLTGSMAICALANLLAALSQSYEHLMLARVLAAVTSAVYTPQVAATLSMLTPEKERAPVLAKLMVGWSVGSVLGNPISVLIASVSSWRMSFAFIGVASAVIALFIWRSVPPNVMVPPLNWVRWFQVLRSPALRWLTAATALTNVGGAVMMSYIAPIVKAVQGIAGAALALLLFTAGAGALLGNLLSVRMVRRFGATLVAYRCNITSATMLLLWPLFSFWAATIYVAQFLWSLGSSGFPAVQQARLVAVAPMLAAATIALNSSVTYLGMAVGASIGATAWPLVPPRFMSWVGFVFVVAALACSVLGDRAAKRETIAI